MRLRSPLLRSVLVVTIFVAAVVAGRAIWTPWQPASNIALTTCHTEFMSQTEKVSLPTQIEVSRNDHKQLKQLSLYTNEVNAGLIPAPTNWRCNATSSSDGLSISVYPSADHWTNASGVGGPSGDRGIALHFGGGCLSCLSQQTCTYFKEARSQYESYWNLNPDGGVALRPDHFCAIPTGETTQIVTPSLVQFEDPPHIRGIGALSGGTSPSLGYIILTKTGDVLLSCTLPQHDQRTCRVIMKWFLKSHQGDAVAVIKHGHINYPHV